MSNFQVSNQKAFRLTWVSEYACLSSSDGGDRDGDRGNGGGGKIGGWGFIIFLVCAVTAYMVGGMALNSRNLTRKTRISTLGLGD